jgi:DNA modification methylase
MITHLHEIDTGPHDFSNGELFADTEVLNASNLYRELRETVKERTDAAADIINASNSIWICWCNTNIESTNLTKKIAGAVELTGSMTTAKKESIIRDFSDSKIKVLVSKPSMCGFGLNWQHVSHVAFVGLSYSFEQRYQAIRRCWRFGQKDVVHDHVFLSHAEKQVFRAVQKKEANQLEMEKQISTNLLDYQDLRHQRLNLVTDMDVVESSGENWKLVCGDACKLIKDLPDESVHFQIFSPPFSSLYIYSDNLADMGNSKNDDEFFEHFEFLITELKRTLVSGRLCAVHCKDLVDYKGRDGMAGIRDFSGEIVKRFESHGWKYHSRVTIWKDPVIEMQRTKAQGLLHKQIKNDSSVSRVGLPDYLLMFRKWPESGETSGPAPVNRPAGFDRFIGTEPPNSNAYEMIYDEDSGLHHLTKIKPGDDIFSIHVWQRYASPVWFDIQQTDVLNCRIARESEDEKHICPLQLPVIKRAVHLWTNPGDTVLTPFAGVGSELYGAVEMGRRAIGYELKMSYFDYAVKILKDLENRMRQTQLTLF